MISNTKERKSTNIEYLDFLTKWNISLSKYSNYNYFFKLFNKEIIYSPINSMKDHEFSFGDHFEKFHAIFGKPIYKTHPTGSNQYQIFIYECKVFETKTIFEFHFFKNQLFFFNKTFPFSFWKRSGMEIIEMFCKYHQIKETDSIVNKRIMDKYGKFVFVELTHQITINNIDLNSKLVSEFIGLFEHGTSYIN